MLYASDFEGGELKFSAASVPCNEKIYRNAHTVEERFKVWSEYYEKKFLGDVIFHDETRAYQIGVKPLRKRDLKNFSENKSIVNKFEEILRHNQVSDKENAFNRLIALFIGKLVDESRTPDSGEVSFQFKDGSDTHELFQDRLQKLYADGMKKFMGEDIFYLPEDYPDKVFKNFTDEENHDSQIKDLRENFRKLKFYTNNAFAFVEVHNEKLFYLNAKILVEVVGILKDYKIIGSEDLQTLGDLFEQLLDKGFKQNEGQFFTPLPITRFILDSLPLDEIIFAIENGESPKIIDYACGVGHFLTESFKAVNDCFIRNNFTPPTMWERGKLFGVEKDPRLARVSKISLFMHGANEGKIKFGDGLENYPDENISPATFDILVANPPYSVKGFKNHLRLANENFSVLDKISNDGSEIETLFAERISQLVKARGVAAVILPSSLLNKDGKSFIAARESLLKNFYIRAVVQLGSKTFGATGTNTVIMFLERFDEPPRRLADFEDVATTILEKKPLGRSFSREILDGYLKKTGKSVETLTEDDREKIIYFGLTFKQMTLIISAPDDVKAQEKFLGYSWSNAKGREGIVHKKRGGLLFDNDNRAANDTLAAVIRAAFAGKEIHLEALEKYYHYSTLADMIDFDADNFTKKITLGNPNYTPAEYSGNFPLVKLGDIAPFVTERTTLDEIQIADFITTDNMLKDKRGVKTYEGLPQISALVKFYAGDVLISNIRPYLKKIWLADRAGGCSPDVLVFRSRDEKILLSEYLFEVLKEDNFFAFAMSTVKGLKMPRGDKDKIKSYKLPLPPLDVQRQIVAEFNSVHAQIAAQVDSIQNLDAAIKNKFFEMFDDYSVAKNYSFTSLCKDDTASGVKFQTSEYLKSGDVPIIDQGANEIAGYMNVTNNLAPYDDLPCVIFGDHTEIFKLEREKFYLGADGTKIIIPIDRNKLNAMFLFYMLRTEYKPLGGYARHFKNLKSLKFYLPPIELQEKFAEYVENCEALKKSAWNKKAELIAEREGLVRKYFR